MTPFAAYLADRRVGIPAAWLEHQTTQTMPCIPARQLTLIPCDEPSLQSRGFKPEHLDATPPTIRSAPVSSNLLGGKWKYRNQHRQSDAVEDKFSSDQIHLHLYSGSEGLCWLESTRQVLEQNRHGYQSDLWLFLYADGVVCMIRLSSLVKRAWSQKPHAKAIPATGARCYKQKRRFETGIRSAGSTIKRSAILATCQI